MEQTPTNTIDSLKQSLKEQDARYHAALGQMRQAQATYDATKHNLIAEANKAVGAIEVLKAMLAEAEAFEDKLQAEADALDVLLGEVGEDDAVASAEAERVVDRAKAGKVTAIQLGDDGLPVGLRRDTDESTEGGESA